MGIVNVMEDTVRATVDDVLQENTRNGVSLDDYREDIVAYVLNRIPSRYITGERGLIHSRIDHNDSAQDNVDIRLHVYEAISTVQRRKPTTPSLDSESFKKEYYFPYIIGEILEESTFSVIPDVEVFLHFDGISARMIDKAWQNPYKTCKATKGFYLFWPDFVETKMHPTEEIDFEIVFRHKSFYQKIISFKLNAHRGYCLNRYKVIPISLIKLREGEKFPL